MALSPELFRALKIFAEQIPRLSLTNQVADIQTIFQNVTDEIVDDASAAAAASDTMGDHTATQDLDMADFDIVNQGNNDFMEARLSATQTTNLAVGDHIKWDTVQISGASNNITLDTSTAYTTTAAVASIGRFTLLAGKTYKLTSSLSVDGDASLIWYDATAGANISRAARHIPPQNATNVSGSGNAIGIFTPSVDTLVELRFTLAGSVTNIFVDEAVAIIEQIR